MEQDSELAWITSDGTSTFPSPWRCLVGGLGSGSRSRDSKDSSTRPAVVVTSDLYNRENWGILVMPLTSHDSAELDQVLILPPEGGLSNRSVTLPDQLRAVDRSRLVKRLGRVRNETILKVNRSLQIVLDLP